MTNIRDRVATSVNLYLSQPTKSLEALNGWSDILFALWILTFQSFSDPTTMQFVGIRRINSIIGGHEWYLALLMFALGSAQLITLSRSIRLGGYLRTRAWLALTSACVWGSLGFMMSCCTLAWSSWPMYATPVIGEAWVYFRLTRPWIRDIYRV